MASKHLVGAALFACALAMVPIQPGAAQDRSAPVRPARVTAKPQVEANVVRTELATNLTGISADEVEATKARLDRARSKGTDEPMQSQLGSGRTVSRADIAALQALPAPTGAALARGNILPPPVRPSGPQGVRAPGGAVDPSPPAPNRPGSIAAPPQPYLDVNGFGQDLHNALRGSVQGYTMRLRRNGQNIYTLQWNWARRPSDGSRGWNPDRRQNIASVSKFITAIAMVDLLDKRNIDPSTPIAQWLPAYWNLGPNVNKITFEMLMTHSSGLANSGSTDFPTMRQMVQNGVTPNLPTGFTYENTNFGLQRILIATLGNYVNRNMSLGNVALNDGYWDAATTSAYADYVQKNVFTPAGVSGASFANDANSALAYAFFGGNAWDSGDLSWRAGSGGWHLSVDEILDVAATYRYSGKIVSTGKASNAITQRYGLDGRWSTPAGFVYHKNGSWAEQSGCPAGQRQEQSLLLLMPGNMEMALLVNSPVGQACTFLRGVVEQVYRDNIVEP